MNKQSILIATTVMALFSVLVSCGRAPIYEQETLFSKLGLETVAKPLRIELPLSTQDQNLRIIRPGYEAPASSSAVLVWKTAPTVLFLYKFENPQSDTGRLLGATYHFPDEEVVVIDSETTALWLVTLPGHLDPQTFGFEDLEAFRTWAKSQTLFMALKQAVEDAAVRGADLLGDERIQDLVQSIWQLLQDKQGTGLLGGPGEHYTLRWQKDDLIIENHLGTPLGAASMDASEEGGVSTSFVRAALWFDRSIFGDESRTLTSLLQADEAIVCVRGVNLQHPLRDLVELDPSEYPRALDRLEAEALVASRLPFMAELVISSVAFVPAYGDAVSLSGDAAYTLVEEFGEDLQEMAESFAEFAAEQGGELTIEGIVGWLDYELRTRQRARSLARKLAKFLTGDARKTRASAPFLSISKKVLELAGKVLVVGDAANLYSLVKDSNGPTGCHLVDRERKTVQDIRSPFIEIDPPGIDEGEVDVNYTFTLTVRFLRSKHFPLVLEWAFGDGANGELTVDGGGSPFTSEIGHAYSAPGAYGLTVSARPHEGVATSHSVHVFIGERSERDYDLDICNTWKAANSGGEGIYLDTWDITAIPDGAVFDLAFNTYCVPDKIIVENPAGQEVLDTGWRGCSSYEGNPNYPGGIAGPGQGFVEALFQKLEDDTSFRVIVVGGEPGTAWDYQVRCRIPTSESAALSASADPAVQELFSRERGENR